MSRLPRSTDDLRGLRAARWVRESTAQQTDRFGPDAQREQQDRALERYGLTDTGIAWSVSHSGRTIATTAAFAEMMASAGRDFDVLLVGYVSRFARDLRTAANARHELHAQGASILFCDERVLSSDEAEWERWAREAVEAEAYSRRLARRVSEGYEAKFRRHRDPGGNAPLGFLRVDGFLAVDPDTIGRVVDAFERYATGTVSLPELAAATGIVRDALRPMLRNPTYNGWVRRHRRSADEQLTAAAWRAHPPVSDDLWARVQEVLLGRYHGGGHPTPRHVHLLAGRLFCVCGARIRADGRPPTRRYRHWEPCGSWSVATRVASTFEGPISAQVQGIRIDAPLLVSLRKLAGSTSTAPDSTSLRRRQVERDMESVARQHARRAMTTEAYLAEHARLSQLLDAVHEHAEAPVVDPDLAVDWLRNVRGLWTSMDDAGRRDLAAAIYERVTVTSEGFSSVRLTAEAQRHGAMLAMPEMVRARPEGNGSESGAAW